MKKNLVKTLKFLMTPLGITLIIYGFYNNIILLFIGAFLIFLRNEVLPLKEIEETETNFDFLIKYPKIEYFIYIFLVLFTFLILFPLGFLYQIFLVTSPLIIYIIYQICT